MMKFKRAAAAALACVMALSLLTACSDADINNFFSGVSSTVTSTASGVVTMIGETAKSAVDKVYTDTTEGLNASASQNLDSYRQQILDLVNAARRKEGLSELTMTNTQLSEAAQTRAKEIALKYYPAHYRPDGTKCFTVLGEVGLTAKTDYQYAGENIASGWVSPVLVMQAWMNSPGHRANILNPNYTQIGIGYYFDINSPSGATFYWTQMFLG